MTGDYTGDYDKSLGSSGTLAVEFCCGSSTVRKGAQTPSRSFPVDEMQERPVVTESNQDQIRQGETGHHLRYILIGSCALVVLLFIAITAFLKP